MNQHSRTCIHTLKCFRVTIEENQSDGLGGPVDGAMGCKGVRLAKDAARPSARRPGCGWPKRNSDGGVSWALGKAGMRYRLATQETLRSWAVILARTGGTDRRSTPRARRRWGSDRVEDMGKRQEAAEILRVCQFPDGSRLGRVDRRSMGDCKGGGAGASCGHPWRFPGRTNHEGKGAQRMGERKEEHEKGERKEAQGGRPHGWSHGCRWWRRSSNNEARRARARMCSLRLGRA